jgi:hypothetical protein
MTHIRNALLVLFVVAALVVTGGLLTQYPRETVTAAVSFPLFVGAGRGLVWLAYRARQSRRRPVRAERNEGNDGYYWSH